MLTAEQVLTANKANVATFTDITTKSVEKLVELNSSASKTTLVDAQEHTKALLKAKDAQELLTLQSGQMQPLAEKTVAYSRILYDIASSASSEFSQTLEGLAQDAQKKFKAVMDSAAKSAPAGSEQAMAFMSSAVATASSALESVQKAVKQASAMAESNMAAVTATAATAVKHTAKKA